MVTFTLDGREYSVAIGLPEHRLGLPPGIRSVARIRVVLDDGTESPLGSLFYDARGDTRIATSAVTARIFRPGSIHDLLGEWVAASNKGGK